MTSAHVGKVALVTGAAQGLGRDIALELARQGMAVAVNTRRSIQDAKVVVEQIQETGGQALCAPADVTQAQQVHLLMEHVRQHLGEPSVLVNNVGAYQKTLLLEMQPTDWDRILASNLHSAFYLCQAAIPAMRTQGWGRIFNLGFASAGRIASEPWITAYHIAKTGLLTLTKTYASLLAAEGITANLISPGVLESSVSKPVEQIPAGRLGSHAELLELMNHLLSPAGDYITGNNLEVAGGWRLESLPGWTQPPKPSEKA